MQRNPFDAITDFYNNNMSVVNDIPNSLPVAQYTPSPQEAVSSPQQSGNILQNLLSGITGGRAGTPSSSGWEGLMQPLVMGLVASQLNKSGGGKKDWLTGMEFGGNKMRGGDAMIATYMMQREAQRQRQADLQKTFLENSMKEGAAVSKDVRSAVTEMMKTGLVDPNDPAAMAALRSGSLDPLMGQISRSIDSVTNEIDKALLYKVYVDGADPNELSTQEKVRLAELGHWTEQMTDKQKADLALDLTKHELDVEKHEFDKRYKQAGLNKDYYSISSANARSRNAQDAAMTRAIFSAVANRELEKFRQKSQEDRISIQQGNYLERLEKQHANALDLEAFRQEGKAVGSGSGSGSRKSGGGAFGENIEMPAGWALPGVNLGDKANAMLPYKLFETNKRYVYVPASRSGYVITVDKERAEGAGGIDAALSFADNKKKLQESGVDPDTIFQYIPFDEWQKQSTPELSPGAVTDVLRQLRRLTQTTPAAVGNGFAPPAPQTVAPAAPPAPQAPTGATPPVSPAVDLPGHVPAQPATGFTPMDIQSAFGLTPEQMRLLMPVMEDEDDSFDYSVFQ